MSPLDGLARDLDRLADNLGGPALTRVVGDVAYEAKQEFESEVRRAAGGDLTLSGWPRIRKISVGYELEEGTAEFRARPPGPMAVLNSGRRPGSRRPRRGGRRSVSWGATRSRHTWDRTVLELGRTLADRIDTAARRVIEEILRG